MLGLVGVFVIKVGRINRLLICIYGGFIDMRCEVTLMEGTVLLS